MPTGRRARPRCSARTSCQRSSDASKLYSYSRFWSGLANQLARSHPASSPKTAPCCSKMVVEWGAPHAARGCLLAIGEVVGVQKAQRFGGSVHQVVLVALEGLHAGDVDVAQIERFGTAVHPFRQCHASAAAGLDPDRIEACRDPDVVHFRCRDPGGRHHRG